MNTIRSTWLGWGTLCVAGGSAYVFAKRSINADRTARDEESVRRKTQLAAMESEYKRKASSPPPPTSSSRDADANSSSTDANAAATPSPSSQRSPKTRPTNPENSTSNSTAS
ncbi:uncharacterized protein TRUGW13939_08149 [Talaromyces rugulosus]|uniref:Uncharacterized protein n=1 Tax=Talaromyces rugulosus TaxID=121627 RepID=A0A7H8R8B7_TALRU|nr:uncharacterized protein TRUGW13939_08149 [Talaromyces rugulosus]QKX61003.1 hypothetical protein TRUGW13939_08149 [Talaromyces rugulosus]